MTCQKDSTLPEELLEQVTKQGFDIMPELIRIMINSAMQGERQKYLGAGPYERIPARRAHANGFQLQQNASQYEPHRSMKREVAADVRAIFNTPVPVQD